MDGLPSTPSGSIATASTPTPASRARCPGFGRFIYDDPVVGPSGGVDLAEGDHETVSAGHIMIKDRILKLNDEELELLVAAVLRAMGYKARVTPKGPDRGVDVIASPDGLGLEEPRIKAEVKHRKNQMGAQDVRSFLGGLRHGDRALYVSTGGFSKDAGYEADRSNIPITLLTLDDLASLVVTHYENFDMDGKVLIPLTRLYWPVE
jgi:restriction system protein